ncbi:hypothetical protein [Symbiopectobacterium purcellii]|uniref:Lipoprotein n=1 Tax=Symbiopectobacterium purcellii TaxID=2871826 RepID=A0ABX9AMI9_9ENTR|nr:hypothetical protein [Symbiopectobacterium purcellii]QZN96011.1 hypothetical protein K6K13_00445 [Symbiopectobacterium purcellii]
MEEKMTKYYSVIMLTFCLGLTGCQSFAELGRQERNIPVYKDPPQSSENLARIRFVGNVTGTSLLQKSDVPQEERDLVAHTMLGFYNDTRDIGIPKLSYRPQDYKGYYFEIKVKPEPTLIKISTDVGPNGACHTVFLITPEAGKDYDLNYDQKENKKVCVMHFNEIVRDATTGVTVLKPAPYRAKKYQYTLSFND